MIPADPFYGYGLQYHWLTERHDQTLTDLVDADGIAIISTHETRTKSLNYARTVRDQLVKEMIKAELVSTYQDGETKLMDAIRRSDQEFTNKWRELQDTIN